MSGKRSAVCLDALVEGGVMKLFTSIAGIKQVANAMLEQADALEKLAELDIPGRFVISPPACNRLSLSSLDELHAARTVLRKHFGWRDHMESKFYSGGGISS